MSTSENSVARIATVRKELEAQGVRYVRIIVVSFSNVIRAKIVPLDRFFKLFAPESSTKGIYMSMAILSLPMYQDQFLEGLPSFLYQVGEMCVVPELETVRKLPYSTHTHAICHAKLVEKDPKIPGEPEDLDICPRTCLRRIIRAAEEAGITFLVGFETEVIFLSEANPPTAVNKSSYLRLSAFDSVEIVKMTDEIAQALEEQGIGVGQIHAEGAPGQYEFVTDPFTPVEAVDALILTRQTIINIAAKYNVKATFAPKVFLTAAGTGSHCHISIHSKSASKSNTAGAPAGMTNVEEAFLSGILKHLRGISAFLLSSTNSYQRLGEGALTGVHIGWGLDNRETPLRVAYSPSSPQKVKAGGRTKEYRVEVRSLDGTANPYLALAAVFTAGFYGGIQKKLVLPSKELKENPAKMSAEERKAHGVTERLPGSLTEALAALEADSDLLVQGISSNIIEVFKVIKTNEVEYMEKLDTDAQIQVVIKNY